VPGVKTNEAPGTRAVLRHYRMSAYKAREVLDLIRGRDADRAEEILNATPREAARVVGKVLASAVANARNNDQLDPDELFVSACYADEGTTLKRWRPRARGRATRIRKRTCHITVIVSRLPEDKLERRRARQAALTTGLRSRRVAASRRGEQATSADTDTDTDTETEVEDLDTTAEEGFDDSRNGDDDEGAEAEGAAVTEDDEPDADEVEQPDSPEAVVDAGAQTDTETESGADTETETAADTEAEAVESPAPKARRARKSTKKAAGKDEDGGDGDGAGEEEKG